MLPEIVHEHDRKWFKEEINKLPVAYQQHAISKYVEAYHDAIATDPLNYRRIINTKLRKYVIRVNTNK